MDKPEASAVPPVWRLIRRLLGRLLAGAAHRVLKNYTLVDTQGRRFRWLKPEITGFVQAMEVETEALRPGAQLETLPSIGNRLMVELAVYTAAGDRTLRRMGVEPACARLAVADLGWDVYRRMLAFTSLPVRLLTRDPGRRLRWTISMLLRFPFNAPGAPGYAVESRIQDDDILTHFTHCPRRPMCAVSARKQTTLMRWNRSARAGVFTIGRVRTSSRATGRSGTIVVHTLCRMAIGSATCAGRHSLPTLGEGQIPLV